jgi:hypothetical protein
MRNIAITLAGAALLLSSCGQPDASGIYLSASDRQVILIQIVEMKSGSLTGRLEQVTMGANGTIKDQTIPLDGAASGHDLMFRPVSAWFGGLEATGKYSGDSVTMTGTGITLQAERSSLDEYQAAVSHLQTIAAVVRQRIATIQAARAAQAQAAREAQAALAAQNQAIQDAANKTATIESATVQLRNDMARMDEGLAKCPDFGQRSAANTARIDKMLRVATTLSGVERNQLIVEANQIEVGTNQIEVARSQYAIALNQIVQDARPIADQLQRFCNSPQRAQFAQPCADATAATTDFQTSLARGRNAFNGYKQAVQDDLARQSAMIQRMGD